MRQLDCSFRYFCAALPGITLFVFHGRLNEKFDKRESGTWDRDIVRVREGRFTFYERDTVLKVSECDTPVCWHASGHTVCFRVNNFRVHAIIKLSVR